MRDEWVAQVGHIDQYGDPRSFKPYWTSQPFPTRAQAVEALEAHEEVIGYSKQLMRYRMAKSYTSGQVNFRRTEVDQYDK
jgi:hypothetical protein